MMPRSVKVVWAIALASLVATVLLAWHIEQGREAQTRSECHRAVATRQDGRAMWLYLVHTYRGDDAAQVHRFRAELDRRLPALKCVDGSPVPRR